MKSKIAVSQKVDSAHIQWKPNLWIPTSSLLPQLFRWDDDFLLTWHVLAIENEMNGHSCITSHQLAIGYWVSH